MGRAKEQYLEDHDRGYYESSDYICEKHFADKDFVGYIKKNGSESNSCSFCEAQEEDNEIQITVPFNDLMDIIVKCIHRSFDDPEKGLSYDSSDYSGPFGATDSGAMSATDSGANGATPNHGN